MGMATVDGPASGGSGVVKTGLVDVDRCELIVGGSRLVVGIGTGMRGSFPLRNSVDRGTAAATLAHETARSVSYSRSGDPASECYRTMPAA